MARKVRKVHGSVEVLEGGGFKVRRPFPVAGIDQLDPFLLLDEMGPTTYGPGEAVGAPTHPHRGFETVTYLLEGAVEHADSAGNRGTIGAGAVQWMTAGGGVLHSELPPAELLERGGRVHGVQLWVNLPAARKMAPPRYQGYDADQLPVAEADDGRVRAKVIAGTVLGTTGPVEPTSPVAYAHLVLQPGARVDVDVPEGHTALVYVLAGAVAGAGPGDLVEHERAGGPVHLASEDGAEALLLTGAPLGEPIARYGPFVMNTRAQLVEALDDVQRGTFVRSN